MVILRTTKSRALLASPLATIEIWPLVAVTGPQRGKLRHSGLRPYFAVPHGDMMISGCFGLVRAFAEKYPQHREEIEAVLEP